MTISIPSRRRSDRTSDPSHPEPLHALLVDDDPDYLAYVSAFAERSGFEVTRAPDGPSAVASLEGTHFDLIVVDQEMPRVTGLQLIGTIREHESARGAFALMLTGREDVLTKVAALDAGFDDFVRKSESEAEIAAKLIAARRVIMRQRALDRAANELYGLATRDDLTGLFNRRLFLAEAEKMLAGGPLCLILFDLDGFKAVNDTHGHVFGDRVLRDVGAALQRVTRPEDIVARYGGDEFVMVVPAADCAAADRIAERLLDAISALRWTAGARQITVGATAGIAHSRGGPESTISHLLQAADRELYARKRPRNAEPPRSQPQL